MMTSRAGRTFLGVARIVAVVMFVCSGLCCQQGQKAATPAQAEPAPQAAEPTTEPTEEAKAPEEPSTETPAAKKPAEAQPSEPAQPAPIAAAKPADKRVTEAVAQPAEPARAPEKAKPMGMLTVSAAGAEVVTGTPARRLAAVEKGKELPFFAKRDNWYSVEVDTPQGPQKGWLHSKYVTVAGAEPKAPEQWVTVTSDQAEVRQQKSGKWHTAATLKRGAKVKVLKVDKAYYKVETMVGGKPVVGWLRKESAR